MSVARLERWLYRGLILGLLAFVAQVAGIPAMAPQTGRDKPITAQLDAAGAVVTWPPSTGLLVSEVVTRGAASADQYVELYNASAGPLDLAGLELVYVTASGLTITRKQSWTSLSVPSHAHVLIANAGGIYAGGADGLFSNGGFSSSGGALVLRVMSGGQVIDALAWGTAANAFVEGTVGTAPPTGSSLERKPGGLLGNAIDTNDNSADTRLEPGPQPQNLAAQPVPAPSATPSPLPTPTVGPTAFPSPTPETTATPVATASADPSAQPTMAPTDEPTPAPTPAPTLPPTPEPMPEPTATAQPTPSPTPTALTIAQARTLPLGTTVTIAGQLTTPTGLTESGSGAFVEDGTAGVAIYLAGADWPLLPATATVIVTGVLETRYSLLTVKLASAADIVATGAAPPPVPIALLTGAVDESVESRLVTVAATVSDGISTLADGFSTAVDDGSGSLRVIVAALSLIAPESLARGTTVQLTGVVGQRDTSGTGLAGYRLHLRSPADVVSIAEPSPSATPSPVPTAEPTATSAPSPSAAPTETPAQTPTPTPAPTPTAAPISIAAARMVAVGEMVRVAGTVTVEPGQLPGDALFAIQDSTGGICVALPADFTNVLPRGSVVVIEATVAAPYGNLELRPATAASVSVAGTAALPDTRLLHATELGDATEGLLASVSGTLARIESSTTSFTLFLDDGTGEARIFVASSLGIAKTEFLVGSSLQVTGIVGDRLGLFRLWPRDRADFVVAAPPPPSPTAEPSVGPTPTPAPSSGGSPTPTPPPAAAVVPIASALRQPGATLAVEGVVTAPAGLLDADGRRVTVQDASAAILVRLPADDASVELGQRVLIVGEVGTYYGAPQITASAAPAGLRGGGVPAPIVVRTARLAPSLEWRLVTASGTVTSVTRDGDAWKAEVDVGGGSLPVSGMPRSAIPSTALVVGRQATVIGIVKRPYPTASDQRFMLVPRMASDIKLGGAAGAQPSTPAHDGVGLPVSGGGTGEGSPEPWSAGVSTSAAGGAHAPAMALADIAAHEGELVFVGGRVEALDGDRLMVNDGTSLAALRLSATAAAVGPMRSGMLVNARGVIGRTEQGGLEIAVAGPDDIRVLDALLIAAQPMGAQPAAGPKQATDTTAPRPANNAVPLALAGLLALAGMFGSAGVAIARRPHLARAIRLTLANLRSRA